MCSVVAFYIIFIITLFYIDNIAIGQGRREDRGDDPEKQGRGQLQAPRAPREGMLYHTIITYNII